VGSDIVAPDGMGLDVIKRLHGRGQPRTAFSGYGTEEDERAALTRIVDQGIDPVIRMRRRWFFATGAHTIVVERSRGGGFTVGHVPSS
jgi:hypothetical protein